MFLRAAEGHLRDEMFDLLPVEPDITRSRLRRMAITAAVGPLQLGTAEPASITTSANGQGVPLTLKSIVPFEGDEWLFRCSPPVWPPARTVLGTVHKGALVLQSEGWSGEEQWLAAVIGSELVEVERIIAAQRIAIRHQATAVGRHMREMVDRIYPRIRAQDLQHILLMLSLGARPQLREKALQAAVKMRSDLWRVWTRPVIA